MVTKGEWSGKGQMGDRIGKYTLPYLKYLSNKDLLHSTGNSCQYSLTT